MTTDIAPVPAVQDIQQTVVYGEHDEEEGYILPPEAWPDVSHLVTEDDEPMDNIFSEKQQRLLTESLMSSWAGSGDGRTFIAFANVGLFHKVNQQAIVPDVMLSLDVTLPDDIWQKSHRSYMAWEFGKPPDVVIEIVSNQKGGEDGHKLHDYAKMGIDYYVIYDPMEHLDRGVLRVYERYRGAYVPLPSAWMDRVGLGVLLWQGNYEGREDTWLRWYNENDVVIPTGKERAEQECQRAEQANQRAEQECRRAEQANQRAEQERQEKERALHDKEQERQEKERALLIAEQAEQRAKQERTEKEQALLRAEQLAAKLRELGVDM